MSYDKPNRIKYSFHYDDGNNGNKTFTVYGSKGKAGRLYDYGVQGITEGFTSNGGIKIGNSGDDDHYGTVLATGATAADGKCSVRALHDENADKASFDALMVNRDIDADTGVQMTVVADSATGIGDFFMIIDWDD